VLLVPANEAPHREIEPEPGADVRLEMTALAAADNDAFGASDVETSREGPSFTYRTLELLTEDRPGDEFWFVMGADVAVGLEGWRKPRRVLELARLAIAARPGTELDEAEAALERLGGSDRADLVRMPEMAVSSTRIRRRIAQRRPIRYLVPDAVRGFIDGRGLYRA
jgi:nicotinate-nucleotide adenylyltransferase